MISVITTNYNYSEYISDAINSILNQTFKNFEYIIIDDGSTDNSDSVIRKFDDSRIRFFKINHVGRSAALNFAIKQSSYEIIALMDADDISHPQRIEKEIEKLKNKNQIVFCDAAYFTNNKIVYVNSSPKNLTELKVKILLHGHLNNSSAFFYKKFIIENLGYNETLTAYEDYDLWMRVFLKCEFIAINSPLHFVRLHNQSLTTSNQSQKKLVLYSIQENYFDQINSLLEISEKDKIKLKAWREFFYGDKDKSRKYWRSLNFLDIDHKIVIAYILSYLSGNLISIFKNNRLRLKLEFLFRKRFDLKNIQHEFESVYKNLNHN